MANNTVQFRLKNGMTPASWVLPQENVTGKFNEGGQVIDRSIIYIKGTNTIWAHEYKGDKKPGQTEIEFEDGFLEVSKTNALLLEYLRAHPWYNAHFEEVDLQAEDRKVISDTEKIEKALELIKGSDNLESKAIAVAVFGDDEDVISWDFTKCLARLREAAVKEPQKILDKTSAKENYNQKYLVSLAVLRGILNVSFDKTSVSWADGSGEITKVAIGENPINAVAKMISDNTEAALATMQKLGVAVREKKAESTFTPPANESAGIDASVNQLLKEQQEEIENLKRQLAEKSNPNPSPAPVEVKGAGTSTTSDTDPNDDAVKALEINDETPIEAIREVYEKLSGKGTPIAFKNNRDWLIEKIDELKAAAK